MELRNRFILIKMLALGMLIVGIAVLVNLTLRVGRLEDAAEWNIERHIAAEDIHTTTAEILKDLVTGEVSRRMALFVDEKPTGVTSSE